MTKLILASQSPRREEILRSLGYTFEIIPANTEESFDPALELDEALANVARQKAASVFEAHPESVVLAADTIVCLDGKILGKPRSRKEAEETLRALSGRSHEVKTGLCLISPSRTIEQVITTKVHFRDLDPYSIDGYLNRNTYQDKAGSYGIQETDFVNHLEGSYSNVVGLPMSLVDQMLKDLQQDPSIQL